MTTFASSARPPWAVTMWVDDHAVYMELPVKNGPPYITKHEFCEGGLSKALGMMRDIYRAQAPSGGSYNLTKHPLIEANAKAKSRSPQATDAQREAARATLKRLGITK